MVYLVLYFWYQYRAYEDLRSLPYVQYRLISMAIRVEVGLAVGLQGVNEVLGLAGAA